MDYVKIKPGTRIVALLLTALMLISVLPISVLASLVDKISDSLGPGDATTHAHEWQREDIDDGPMRCTICNVLRCDIEGHLPVEHEILGQPTEACWYCLKIIGPGPLANYDGRDIPDDMLSNDWLDALAYLGYNVDYLISSKHIYEKGWHSSAMKKDHSSYMSNIHYADPGTNGLHTKAGTSVTGLVPDVSKFVSNGWECADWVAYVYCNYFVNIKGYDLGWLADKIGNTRSPDYGWLPALKALADAGDPRVTNVGKTAITKSIPWSKIDDIAHFYDSGVDTSYYIDYSKLKMGDILFFKSETTSRTSQHIGIYLGMADASTSVVWQNTHFMMDICNGCNGPNIMVIEYMADAESKGLQMLPTEIYRLNYEKEAQMGWLQVTKSVPNGGGLGGWQFTIYSDSGCTKAVETITTNTNGKATSSDLTPGTYYVKETGPSKDSTYWTTDSSVKTVTVKAGETATTTTSGAPLTFTNYGYGILSIRKYTPNGGGLGGWQFTLYKSDKTTVVDTYTTKTDGTYTTGKLAPGTYWIKETGPAKDANYWELDNEMKQITISLGSTTTVDFNNYRYGLLKIQKYSPNGGAVGGWEFTIYTNSNCTAVATFSDGTPAENLKTNTDGVYISRKLAPGTYWVKETGPTSKFESEYWALDTTPKQVIIAAESTTTVEFNNYQGGLLKIQKYTPNGGSLSGWEFTIYTNADCTTVATFVDGTKAEKLKTDASGVYTSSVLNPGTYWVKETGPTMSSDYWVLDTTPKQVTISLGSTAAVEFNNYGYGKIEIIKDTPSGGTKEGWQFTIYRNSACTDVVDTYTSDAEGKITTDKLTPGTYYIKETGYPAGIDNAWWEMDSSVKTIEVTVGTTQSVTFINRYQGKAQITKTTPNGGTKAGWTFTIYSDSRASNVIATLTTDENGIANSVLLTPGTYYVKETGAPSDVDTSYWSMDNTLKTVVVTAGQITKVSFTNYWYGKVAIRKTTSTGNTLSGWQFQIYADEACTDPVGGIYRSGVNGTITTNNLAPGTYWVKEVGYPSNMMPVEQTFWSLDSTPQKVIVTAGETAEVTFFNQRGSSLGIIKTATNGGTVEGWEFTLYYDERCTKEVGSYRTSSDGIILAGGLDDTRIYYIKETDYPEDMTDDEKAFWTLDTSVKSVDFTSLIAGTTPSVTFVNNYSGSSSGYINITKETPDGGTLAGWEFTVYRDSACTQVLGVYRTNASGKIRTASFGAGTYYIKETDYPSGMSDEEKQYWDDLPTEAKQVIVSRIGVGSVTFSNRRYGKIELIKTTNTGGTLNGWQFTIYSDSACSQVVGTYRSGSDGSILTDRLSAGTYYIRETDYPMDMSNDEKAKWTLDSSTKQITLSAGTTESVTFLNNYAADEYGYVTIVKDTPNGGTKAGWEFTIYSDAGCTIVVGTYRSNADGTITTSQLKTGTYYIKETDYPTNMRDAEKQYWASLPTTAQSVTVEANRTASVTFSNSRYGKVAIIKDTTNGGTKEGWKFTIYTDVNCTTVATFTDGTKAQNLVSDAMGNITSKQLPAGTYYVKEVGYPDSMTDAQRAYWGALPTTAQSVTVNAGETATVTFTNNWYGKLQVIKTSTNGGRVDGWVFTVYRDATCTQVVATLTTGSDGTITSGLLDEGTYYIKETGCPADMTAEQRAYWKLDSSIKTVQVVAGSTIATGTTFENVWGGKLDIQKLVTNSTTKQGWKFKIYTNALCTVEATYVDGTAIGTLVSDSSGYITLSGLLAAGEYWVKEVGYPDDMPSSEQAYWVMDAEAKHVVITAGTTTTVTFTNIYVVDGSIIIKKTAPNGGTVKGWQFRIYYDVACLNPVNSIVYVTGEDGTITVSGLSAGTYYIKEVGYPSDMSNNEKQYWAELPTEPQMVVLEVNSSATVTFSNLRYGKIAITKTTSTGGTLAGWQFTLYSDAGCTIVVGTYRSNADGTIVTDKLAPGTYYIKETDYPTSMSDEEKSKWTLDSSTKTIVLASGTTSSATFHNTYTEVEDGRITITKNTTNGGTKEGWQFTVYRDSLCTQIVGTYRSSSNGTITTDDLAPGTYWIKETDYPVGMSADEKAKWTLDSSVKSVVLSSGETGSVTFTNNYTDEEEDTYGVLNIVKETPNGGTVAGWEFTIYSNAGCTDVVGTFRSNSLGVVLASQLVPGMYWVKETDYPTNMSAAEKAYWAALPTTAQMVVVEADKTATVTFSNARYGKIQITKTTNTGGTLSGWEFTIYSNSACTEVVGTYRSGTNGVITTDKLTPGTYWIKETGYPTDMSAAEQAKWTLDSAVRSLTITAGATFPVTFSNNYTEDGRITIVKNTTNNGTRVGWQFTIYRDSGCTDVVGTYRSGPDGTITTGELTPGTYYIKETDYPTGMSDEEKERWTLDASTKNVVLTTGSIASVTFTNSYDDTEYGYITVTKTTTNGGTKSGWQFTIYKDANCTIAVATLTTDASGSATSDQLEVGTYYVKETGYPSGMTAAQRQYWVLDNTVSEVLVEANATATTDTSGSALTYTNNYYGMGQIQKTVTNNLGTKAGWKFTIYTNPGCTIVATFADGTRAENLATDANGYITFGLLPPGTYYVKEVGHPNGESGYYWNDLPTAYKTITITAGSTASVTFNNDWYGRVSINKTLANPEAGTLNGWLFTIYTNVTCTTVATDCYGNKLENLVTDSMGNIISERLAPGTYYIKEVGYTGAPEFAYWFCVSENPQRITVTAGATQSVSFVNALRPGEITVNKTDTNGNALAGVTFLLEYSEDNGLTWHAVHLTSAGSTFVEIGGCNSAGLTVDGTLTTGANGIVTFSGLYPLHMYRLTEVSTQSGYQMLTDSIYVGQLPLNEDLELSFTVVNHKLMEMPNTGSNEMVILSLVATAFASVGFILLATETRKRYKVR